MIISEKKILEEDLKRYHPEGREEFCNLHRSENIQVRKLLSKPVLLFPKKFIGTWKAVFFSYRITNSTKLFHYYARALLYQWKWKYSIELKIMADQLNINYCFLYRYNAFLCSVLKVFIQLIMCSFIIFL